METNTTNLNETTKELFNQDKFNEVIELLTDNVLKRQNDSELYARRGAAWYKKKDYDKAIKDYNMAIALNSDYESALYNRGLTWFAKKEYDKAIEDYNKVIEHNTTYIDDCYLNRGYVWKAKGDYNKAIEDYTTVINMNSNLLENAYYSRGLARKEENSDLIGSKQDFEKYLELTTGKIDEKENSIKYAKYYIEDLNAMIRDPDLKSIRQLVDEIKNKLLIKEESVHYTKLSVLKKLILEESKFQISEGNFLNDPSEGKEFFKYINYKPNTSCNDNISSERFVPKPFIGSFVTKDKHNDLNMWRFYGKEEREEAKGCAIKLRTQRFIDCINDDLSNEKNKEARLEDESDINFYRVIYVEHNKSLKFYIPDSDKEKELNNSMKKLKTKINNYLKVNNQQGDRNASLEKYLNSIAFLFKNDAYKNENEIRLVIKGIEFDKKYDMDVNPPRVYIELGAIKKIVSQITLGPKVDKVNEWASAFHYRYKENEPEIIISHLPYK